jgi:uncharacterized protein DUF4893
MRHLMSTAVLFAALAGPAFATWQNEVNSYDQSRLLRLGDSRADGLREAERGAPRRDLDAIHGALGPQGGPISGRALLGTWQCRQMKLGGLTPSIVYDWFTCRVRETRNGLYFEKVTGTEKISGYLEDYENGRMLLLGAITVKKERSKPYSGANIGAGAETTSSDAVGVVSSAGRSRARIEFPYPNIESDFDVMELKR